MGALLSVECGRLEVESGGSRSAYGFFTFHLPPSTCLRAPYYGFCWGLVEDYGLKPTTPHHRQSAQTNDEKRKSGGFGDYFEVIKIHIPARNCWKTRYTLITLGACKY
jgi:hypothetical protein